jgi:hypothetical protein
MAKLRDILYCFDFGEAKRSEFTFSDATKVRLDPDDHRLKLKADSDGAFPLDADLNIATGVFWPRTGKVWRGFYAEVTTPTGTSIGYKLNNDTDDYYWDGGAWAVAGASDWNTEADIAANIVTFPPGKLAIVTNLVTTDATVTPSVEFFHVGYSAQVVFLEQWVYRTLVPKLRDNLRPPANYAIPIGATTSTIDLDSYPLDTSFHIVGIDSVYNHTDDDDHLTDLFSSYDSGTNVITLSAPIAAGKVAWINFLYEPLVAVVASVDYTELSRLPAITIENIRITAQCEIGHKTGLVNKATGAALIYETPWQCVLKGDIVISAPRSLDEMGLSEEVMAFLNDNQTLTIDATGEQVDWTIDGSPYDRDGGGNLSDVRSATVRFKLWPLRMWLTPATAGYAVTGLIIGGDVNVEI